MSQVWNPLMARDFAPVGCGTSTDVSRSHSREWGQPYNTHSLNAIMNLVYAARRWHGGQVGLAK